MLTPESEAVLIRKAGAGDTESLNKLWEAYEKAIEGFIRVRLKVDGDPGEAAHDVAQNLFIKLRGSIKFYDESKGKFYTFLRSCATFAMLDYLRKDKKRLECRMLLYEFPDLESDEAAVSFLEKLPDFDPQCLDIIIELNMYRTLLELTFSVGGYPHQLIAFGFNRVVSEWHPKSIVEKLSGKTLSKLEQRLEKEYTADSKLDAFEIRKSFSSLRDNLTKSGDEIGFDKTTLDNAVMRDNRFLEWKLEDTKLELYFSANPAANIADWSNKVINKVRRYIIESEEFV